MQIGARIAGFAKLEANGHLDLLYVHPDFGRRGFRVTREQTAILQGVPMPNFCMERSL
jgi:hypothetical protein